MLGFIEQHLTNTQTVSILDDIIRKMIMLFHTQFELDVIFYYYFDQHNTFQAYDFQHYKKSAYHEQIVLLL